MDLGWLTRMSAPSAEWGADGSARPSLPPSAVVGRVWLSAPELDVDPRLCGKIGDAGNVVPTALKCTEGLSLSALLLFAVAVSLRFILT